MFLHNSSRKINEFEFSEFFRRLDILMMRKAFGNSGPHNNVIVVCVVVT